MSFSAMLAIENGDFIKTNVFLALATATRTNGMVNLGFVLYKSLKTVATTIIEILSRSEEQKLTFKHFLICLQSGLR